MTFTQRIKAEIFQQPQTLPKFWRIMQGVFFALAPDGQLSVVNPNLLAFLQDNVRKFGLETQVKVAKNQVTGLDDNFRRFPENVDAEIWHFLTGIFLASGSVNDPTSVYNHLEMKIRHEPPKFLLAFLRKRNLIFFTFRKGNYHVLYVKRAEMISDFLKALGASRSVLEFENFRISRDFTNNLNRISNLEFSNQEKISIASFDILDAIEIIENHRLHEQFSAKERKFMQVKKRHPYESLQTLALRMAREGVPISKSGLNHWIRKIKRVAYE